jgi:hypothetical protein
MGMYVMCPACKAVNGPCEALNCQEFITALGRKYGGGGDRNYPLPELIYPDPWYRKWCAWWKHVWVAHT